MAAHPRRRGTRGRGTRLAVLAPIADVGLIVVDDEHDAAYKSDRTPRYQPRDVALALGRLRVRRSSWAVPLRTWSASAARTAVSSSASRSGSCSRVRPDVEIVDLRDELASGNRGLLSDHLFEALGRSIGWQVIARSWSSTGVDRPRWCCAATAATSRFA